MKKTTHTLDSINFILQVCMFSALLLMVSKSLFFKQGFNQIFLWAFVIYGFFVLKTKSRWFSAFVYFPVICIVLGGLFSMIPSFVDPFINMVSHPMGDVIIHMRDIFNEAKLISIARFFFQHFMGFAIIIPYRYDTYMMWTIAVLMGSGFYTLNKQKSMLWLVLPIMFFAIQWLRYFNDALGFMNFYIIGLMVYYIVNQETPKLQLSSDALKERRRILLVYGLALALFVSATATLAMAIYPFEKVNRAISKVMPSFLEWRTGYSNPSNRVFSFASTIYKPYGDRLGGSIDLKHDLVMTVKGKVDGLYLRGRVSDGYDGKNWVSSSPDYDVLKQFTDIEPEKALEGYKLEITYSNIETATIFAPYSFYSSSLNPSKVYQNEDGSLYYKKGPFDPKLSTFTVKGVVDSLQPALQLGNPLDPRYHYVPNTVPDNVRILATQATLGATTHRKKMEQLVSYLVTHYTYSLDVADVPENEDFVNYFLTSTQEGYCTYFASSLAIMGRSLGVATRYVEGFVMPKTKSADGRYHITSDLAHAWVEAYIDGEGWVVFEATPPYNQVLKEEEDAANSDLPIPGISGIRPNEREEEDILDQFGGDSDYVAKKPLITWKQGIMLVLMILFVVVLIRVLKIKRALKVQFKESLQINTIRKYYQIEKIMVLLDPNSYRFNTPELMIIRIFDFMRVTGLDKNVILLIVNKALYSHHDINGADLEEVSKFYVYVDQYAVVRLGRLKYWLYKYALNRLTLKRRGRIK